MTHLSFGSARALLTGFLAAALLLLAPTPALAVFVDVASHWSREFVAPLAARGIVQGYPDGRFHPDRPMSRAEFIRMIVQALDKPIPPEVLGRLPPLFADVGPRHWARAYVEAAWELDWLPVDAGAALGPDEPITRAEVALIAARAGRLTEAPAVPARFTDAAAIPFAARPAAAAVVAAGWMTGYPDGSFRPAGVLSRAEAAAVTARLLRSRGGLYDMTGYLTAEPRRVGAEVELTLRLDGGEDASIRVPAGATAWRGEREVAVTQLRFLDEIALITSGPDNVYLEAWFHTEAGRFVAAPPAQGRITYMDELGQRRSRAVAAGAPVARNGRPAALAELQPGDLLELVLARDGSVRAVAAVRVDLRGRIWSSDPGRGRLAIGEAATTAQWYGRSDQVIVFIDGRRAGMDDLRLGDRILAAVDPSGRLEYVEAYRLEAVPR